jgi:hypothetical protein
MDRLKDVPIRLAPEQSDVTLEMAVTEHLDNVTEQLERLGIDPAYIGVVLDGRRARGFVDNDGWERHIQQFRRGA